MIECQYCMNEVEESEMTNNLFDGDICQWCEQESNNNRYASDVIDAIGRELEPFRRMVTDYRNGKDITRLCYYLDNPCVEALDRIFKEIDGD